MADTRKGRQSVNVLLLVLIGFCVLAVIEILYGQAQMQIARERLALEEQNSRTVEELKEEWGKQQDGGSVAVMNEETGTAGDEGKQDNPSVKTTNQPKAEKTDAGDTADKKPEIDEDDNRNYDMQIVILGDSIMDGDRTESGAADIIGEQLNAKIYNMSMGGTTAALMPDEQYDFEKWDSRCLLGVVNAILGNIDTDIFEGYAAGEVLKTCDFSKTDYFIIEYGINDFLTGRIPRSRYLDNGGTLAVDGVHTYVGALDDAVNRLKSAFPDAGILIIALHYCQVFSGDTFIGDGYSIDYGYGPLVHFARGAGYVVGEHEEENVFFFNAFEDSGIDAYTADDYLADGIHMTPAGARVYAEKAAAMIRENFKREE